MKRFFLLCSFLFAMVSCVVPAHARVVGMPQFENEVIASMPSANAGKIVHDAIIEGALGKGWRITRNTPTELRLAINVRRHALTVDVIIRGGSVDVKYVDSVNLNYRKDDDGREFIHPSYGKWINSVLVAARIHAARR
jgi:hypothetical protein